LKYLCLIYWDENKADALTETERELFEEECCVYAHELESSGRHVAAAVLEGAEDAATIRTSENEISVIAGTASADSSLLGGFYLVEARDLNEAIKIAARIPAGRFGYIEVRPVKRATKSGKGENE
jgi:hypothetical protein